jgi:glycosyltransferase involved in cell wall biosynthesis
MTEREKAEKVSVLVPVYNEENAILRTIAGIRKTLEDSVFTPFELIVINDGSTDNTAAKLRSTDVHVITHSSNRGYGSSLKSGLRAAKGEIVVITDADGTYPLERIPDLLKNMVHNDMVVGARTETDAETSLFRRFPKLILRRFASYVVGTPIPDLNSGFRAFRKDAVMKYFRIIPSGFSFTSTITMAMLSDGYQVQFVPIDYFRRLGRSKIRPIKDTISFFSLIMRICLYFSPLRVFVPMSGFFLILALLKMIFDFIHKPLGHFIISQSVLFFTLVSIQIFVLGLVADLIIRRTIGD